MNKIVVVAGLLAMLLAGWMPTALAQSPRARNVVVMIGEEEYHTWETLPEFARTDLSPRSGRPAPQKRFSRSQRGPVEGGFAGAKRSQTPSARARAR
jgi:hypothetical protein